MRNTGGWTGLSETKVFKKMKCCEREEDRARPSVNFRFWKTTGKIIKLFGNIEEKMILLGMGLSAM